MKIAYTRVSSDEQSHEGVSLEMQAGKIASYCDVKDWTLAETITDAGYSAKSLQRPGMQRVLAMVEAGQVEAVIVYKLDRLTRSVSDLDRLVKLFDTHGVALVSLQESLDATTATGRLMMNLLASVSQWEREVIGERTKDAMQHLKATGQTYSRPVFDDDATLACMQHLQAQGMSLHGIAAELNAAHVPTARGGLWRASTVRQILGRSAPAQHRKVA
jgi:site-specific DNA recombinase